jgi:hypothetical protein
VEKVYDVLGLYLNPPEHAVVYCVDEKSQVQALARSQLAFPMMRGMPEKRTHDYVRHGTTTLFAAFNVADGTVISESSSCRGEGEDRGLGESKIECFRICVPIGSADQSTRAGRVLLVP